jgi:hypothetical protein
MGHVLTASPLGHFCPRLKLGEGRARSTGSGCEGPNNNCHCSPTVDYPKRGLHVSSAADRAFTTTDPAELFSYFIKDGRVCESGTHDALLQRRGDYYEYVQLQALSKK